MNELDLKLDKAKTIVIYETDDEAEEENKYLKKLIQASENEISSLIRMVDESEDEKTPFLKKIVGDLRQLKYEMQKEIIR